MVFDVLVSGDFVYAVSDDRSLRIWSTSSAEQLSEAFGHTARPFSIAVDSQRPDEVLTAGADETLYVWHWHNTHVGRSLSLRKRIALCGGFTRALAFYDDNLVSFDCLAPNISNSLQLVATDRGTLMSVDLDASSPIVRPPYRSDIKVQAFQQLSSGAMFILDQNRY